MQRPCAAGVLPALLPLLRHPKKRIRKDVCWALSNIAAGTPVQVAALLEHKQPPVNQPPHDDDPAHAVPACFGADCVG